MKLNDEQKEKLMRHLQETALGRTACPMCMGRSWDAADLIMEMRGFAHHSIVVGGPVVPLITVTCKTCGYTLLFNALRAGIDLTPGQSKTLSQAALEEASDE